MIMAFGLITTICSEAQIRHERQLNIDKVPFSYYGSYMAVRVINTDSPKGLVINNVSGEYLWKDPTAFTIIPIDVDTTALNRAVVTQSELRFETDEGARILMTFLGKDVMRVRCENTGIRVNAVKAGDYSFILNNRAIFSQFSIIPITGSLENCKYEGDMVKSFEIGNRTSTTEFYITNIAEEGFMEQPDGISFDQCVAQSRNAFDVWRSTFPKVTSQYEHSIETALYTCWASTIAPRKNLDNYGILMSKDVMRAIWSWDNCFTALGMSYGGDHDLAWHQIKIVLDKQAENGALPDLVTDWHTSWTCVKPPIYGIVLEEMISRGVIQQDKFAYLYDKLSRLTEYWMMYRDVNKNGIPEYYRNVDTGWDNGTMFGRELKCESPELCAYLIRQLDLLEYLAEKLNRQSDISKWKGYSERLLNYLVDNLWDGNDFFAVNILDNTPTCTANQSLIKYLPLIIGKRLPEDIRQKVINDLKTSGIRTPYGLASENPNSPHYVPDGYWLGPIWAPVNYLMVTALEECQEPDLAREIARDFCNLCNASPSVMGENYNAQNGKPLRDQAYTWTSGAYMSLMYRYNF